ncbi:MAG TPA: hypothetical protein VD927_02350 [Chryseosolibacter sp.]|nr:hypothetical protein [Chryseosolibacter sp.]
MHLTHACLQILGQLSAIINGITQQDFTRPSNVLGGSTIGQHVRHTLEFFICFREGYNSGIVNYDKRAHDKRIESDKATAAAVLSQIEAFVGGLDQDKMLMLEAGYQTGDDSVVTINTNAMREIVYNIEHAVHHMAIIKIGLRDVAPYVEVPQGFGVATSTIRYSAAVGAAS